MDEHDRARILARAGNRCERCGIANGTYRATWADKDGAGESHYRYAEEIDGEWYGWNGQTAAGSWIGEPEPLDRKPARIVLTIAHVTDLNPQALCQRCRTRLDAPMRARVAAATRQRQRLAASGQAALPLEEIP